MTPTASPIDVSDQADLRTTCVVFVVGVAGLCTGLAAWHIFAGVGAALFLIPVTLRTLQFVLDERSLRACVAGVMVATVQVFSIVLCGFVVLMVKDVTASQFAVAPQIAYWSLIGSILATVGVRARQRVRVSAPSASHRVSWSLLESVCVVVGPLLLTPIAISVVEMSSGASLFTICPVGGLPPDFEWSMRLEILLLSAVLGLPNIVFLWRTGFPKTRTRGAKDAKVVGIDRLGKPPAQ